MKYVNVPTVSFSERTDRHLGSGNRVPFGTLPVTILFGFLHIFTCGFRFDSILGKTWVLVRFVFAGFGLFPISNQNVKSL